MRINKAIEHYNDNRKKGTPKMNKRKLVSAAMPHMRLETGEQTLWHWNEGNKYNKLTRDIVYKICKTLNVDANFLFEDVSLKGHPELDIIGVIGVMKLTGMKPNKILGVRAMRKK